MPEPTAGQNGSEAAPTNTEKSDNAEQSADAGEESGSKSAPEGIVPLFFSGKSQEIFECVADKDLTPENPHKLVAKEKIVEDFKNRAAVSDFFPVKRKVLNYPGEELLLVYDYDFKFGENFYICLTEEAKDWVLNPPVDEAGGEVPKGEDEEEHEEIPPTPVPKEWECLGSDLEIKETFMEPGRLLLHFKISRKRLLFGGPCQFSDYTASVHPEAYVEVAPQENPNFDLQRLENDVAIQAVMNQADASSQTEVRKPVNAAVQYSPRSMSEEEAQTMWQDDTMKTFLNNACPRLEVYLQQNSILDLFVDDYKALSDTDGITGNKSDTNLKEYQSFTDLKFSKDKVITWIDWHPTIKGIVAVSCGDSYSFNERIDLSFIQSNFLILIWSFVDPIHPQLFLEAPEAIRCFQFNPSNPNIIVGGCMNGQIVLWNIEDYQDRLQLNKATDPLEPRSMAANLAIFDTDPKLDHAPMVLYCASSAIKESHSMAVSDVQWIPNQIQLCQKTAKVLENPSKKCNQIISCSIDGSVMFWDIRPSSQKKANESKQIAAIISDQPFSYLDLTWKPFLKIPLPRSQFPGNFAGTRVSMKEKNERYKTTGGERVSAEETIQQTESTSTEKVIEDASTKFFVGTEDGEVVYSDWIPTRDSESGKLIASPPESSFSIHCGPVSCLERSPFYRNVLLSVGGWNFALWREGAKSDALFKSCSSTVPLTGGAWSPTRPGVFFITKQNGNVDVWDLLDRSHEPLLAQNISTMSITTIYPWQLTSKQQVLAVGDSSGTLHILEVPWSLSHASTNEESIMEAFFDRELQRLDFTTQRMDVRAKEKKVIDTAKVEAGDKDDNKETAVVKDSESWEDKVKKEYDDYLTMEVKLLIQLGIIQASEDADN